MSNISGIQVAKMLGYEGEKKKYVKCWNVDEYRKYSPGEHLVDDFLSLIEKEELPFETEKSPTTLVDWGCGTGRAAKAFADKGLDVTAVDFAWNCLDEKVEKALGKNFRFVEEDLTQEPGKLQFPSTYGYCTDVMEHIPEGQVDTVLENIMANSRYCFFQIALLDDSFGSHPDIDDDLHVTVRPYDWWLKKFAEMKCIVIRSEDRIGTAIFFVTGWRPVSLKGKGAINIGQEEIISNMAENAKAGIQPVKPHLKNDVEVMILAGGPSLVDFEDEIRENRENGMPMITVNGTYHWAIERGLSPSMQCVIDGKEHNKRFTELVPPYTDETKFMIASQCHPDVLKGLPPERTFMWQVSIDDELIPHVIEHFGEMYKDWWPCPGGSTVTTRTLCLLPMLGFRKFHIYGFDSCCKKDDESVVHHAYAQPENDHQPTIVKTVGEGTEFERDFICHPWHLIQAADFEGMITRVLSRCKLDVKGDGLIAHMLKMRAADVSENIDDDMAQTA